MMSDKQLSVVVEAEIMIPHPPLEINISTCYVRSREISGLCYKSATSYYNGVVSAIYYKHMMES